jgi:hypothetical protein
MPHTISFQYLEVGDREPRAGYQVTDAPFDIPSGATVPRVGEFVQLVRLDSSETYEVLAVTTRISSYESQNSYWHSYVTVGPIKGPTKQTLSIVRE